MSRETNPATMKITMYLLLMWMCGCKQIDTNNYICVNCLVDEDSTWAETTHWHNDTTCLYSLGVFVVSEDTIRCDTIRVNNQAIK